MKIFYTLCIILFFNFVSTVNAGQQRDYLVLINGSWKFQVGDSQIWKTSDYDDSQWETINVPSAWEDQGFFGLDGYAWYRKEFVLPKDYKNKDIFLSLGYIDDVDQVFVNGNLVGFSGELPPHFSTALDVVRKYPVPIEYLNTQGKNVISIRVYDQHLSGGILSGTIGLFTERTVQPDISLNGLWQFRAGDNLSWKEKEHNDKNWNKMVVPGNWKNHGYKDYNGIAWYRKKVSIPEEYQNQKMAFIIGRIENCDEVYINGEIVGNTGIIPVVKKKQQGDPVKADESAISEDCYKVRIYYLPENIFLDKSEITISIRIYNSNYRGGITEGPIGLIRVTSLAKVIKDKQVILEND